MFEPCSGDVVGKSVEVVLPATYILAPALSTAMAPIAPPPFAADVFSFSFPPRYVEKTNPAPLELISETNASFCPLFWL